MPNIYEITNSKKDTEAAASAPQYIPELNCELKEFHQACSADMVSNLSAYDFVLIVTRLREAKSLQKWKSLREKRAVTVVLTSKGQEAIDSGEEVNLAGVTAFSVAIDIADTFIPLRSYLGRR